MHCICYLCGIHYRNKPPFDNEQITHGLCDPCFHIEMKKIKEMTPSPRPLPKVREGTPQMSGLDGYFHEQHIAVQPLPFHLLHGTYPVLNGRGYPDTVNPNPLPAPAENGGKVSQRVSSLITANAGQKVLLRISNLNVHQDFTLATLGIPMKVVGRDARLLRGPDGKNLYYTTNSILLGSGETADAILDTAGVTPGTYFLYTTNLNFLTNDQEDFGGMMTEIRIN